MRRQRETAPPGIGELRREFEFIRELGHGGSAVVYLARDRELEREVAIKLIRRPLTADQESLARFAREARAAARLDHPHIVAVHAVKRLRDGTLALVLQYVPGRTLKQAILADGPFACARVERVLREIGAALRHAHERGIVHRDVKPENIFLHDESGCALLADFGIARTGEPGSGVTVADVALGTPAYMAPEQIDGAPADPRSDLYSLASVGWEMLTGEAPWEGETLYSIIYKQKHEALAPVRSFRPEAPYRLRRTIERGLAKDPARRFPDAAAMLDALDDARGGWLERLRTRWSTLPVRRAVPPPSPTARAAGAAVDRTVDPAAAYAMTIRYRREEPQPGSMIEAAPGEPGTAGSTGLRHLLLTRRGIRYAAASWTLLVLTGAAATLTALTRAAGEGFGSGPAAAVQADELGAAVTAVSPRAGGTAAEPPAAAQWTPAPLPVGAEPAGDEPAGAPAGGADLDADAPGAVAEAPAAAAAEPMPATGSTLEAPGFTTAPAIVAGGLHSCTVSGAGEVFCWGGNSSGQLGDGGRARRAAPARVRTGQGFREVAAGLAHSCGVAASGAAFCWGGNDQGQLGDGTRAARATPVPVSGARRFVSLATGGAHTCGLTAAGELFCWGGNEHGQLGDGSVAPRTTPRRVAGNRFASFATGWNHTCALNRQGQAFCWGANGQGQLGTGDREGRTTPAAAEGGVSFRQIAAGGAHSCGLTQDDRVLCWGANANGQLGDGASAVRRSPTAVEAGPSFASLAAGGVHTCALTHDGRAFCWGGNMYGQLGDGSRTDRARPAPVAGELRFARLHASGSHTCGITRQGERFCWGYNVDGQLGDGTRSHRATPTRVPDAPG